jgi:hypothetical protein
VSRGRVAGAVLSGVAMLFLLVDSLGKLLRVPPVVEGTAQLGFPDGSIRWLGALLLTCVVVHAVPRAAIVGAVLLTGYLGGAVAAHARLGDPLLTHVLFPVYVAAFVWGGLWLRDGRLHHAVEPRR